MLGGWKLSFVINYVTCSTNTIILIPISLAIVQEKVAIKVKVWQSIADDMPCMNILMRVRKKSIQRYTKG